MTKYTVVGFYESNSQVFCAHVTAKDETEAVTKTPKALSDADPDDLVVIAIFKGHHEDLNECQTLSCVQDWPNPNGD